MRNPILRKNFIAGASVSAYRIVKFGADDNSVIQGAAVGDALLGVCDELGADSGKRIDVTLSGVAEVQYGGTVTRGDLLTSDANGKAVTAAPAAGVNNRVIGVAMVSGVLDDIGSVLIQPGRIQG